MRPFRGPASPAYFMWGMRRLTLRRGLYADRIVSQRESQGVELVVLANC